MALESTYTGYTGSHTATTLSTSRMSPMLPQSDLAPSEMKISSSAMSTPRAWKSRLAMAERRKS